MTDTTSHSAKFLLLFILFLPLHIAWGQEEVASSWASQRICGYLSCRPIRKTEQLYVFAHENKGRDR